jgi:hypothetical protein
MSECESGVVGEVEHTHKRLALQIVRIGQTAVAQLQQSWREAADEPSLTEMKALWRSADLTYYCHTLHTQSATPEWCSIERMIAHNRNPATRYRVSAALATIVSFSEELLPYQDVFRTLKHRPPDESVDAESYVESFYNSVRLQRPDAAEHWHRWIWPTNRARGDHGDASVFAIAATELALGLNKTVRRRAF